MSKYRPMMCKLTVRIPKIEEFTKGGILLPDTGLEKENMAKEEGIILAIGACSFEEETVPPKVGDTIAFARYGGKSLGKDKNGDEIRVMRDVDVLVVVEEE